MAICSSTFINLGRSKAKALGVPALPILEIPHPFGTKSPEEIREDSKSMSYANREFLTIWNHSCKLPSRQKLNSKMTWS
jgi:hypothetical protein